MAIVFVLSFPDPAAEPGVGVYEAEGESEGVLDGVTAELGEGGEPKDGEGVTEGLEDGVTAALGLAPVLGELETEGVTLAEGTGLGDGEGETTVNFAENPS